jgi:hypothetical protein
VIYSLHTCAPLTLACVRALVRVRSRACPLTCAAARPPAQVKDPSLLRFLVDMRGEDATDKQLRDDLMVGPGGPWAGGRGRHQALEPAARQGRWTLHRGESGIQIPGLRMPASCEMGAVCVFYWDRRGGHGW